MAISSDIYTPCRPHMYGTPMQTSSFAFLSLATSSVYMSPHTLSQKHSHILGLYSPATSSGQSRQLLQCALQCLFLLLSLSLSVGRRGLQQPTDRRHSLAALLTRMHFVNIHITQQTPFNSGSFDSFHLMSGRVGIVLAI